MFLETSFNVSSRIDKLMSIELTTCQFAIDICQGYQKVGWWVLLLWHTVLCLFSIFKTKIYGSLIGNILKKKTACPFLKVNTKPHVWVLTLNVCTQEGFALRKWFQNVGDGRVSSYFCIVYKI